MLLRQAGPYNNCKMHTAVKQIGLCNAEIKLQETVFNASLLLSIALSLVTTKMTVTFM